MSLQNIYLSIVDATNKMCRTAGIEELTPCDFEDRVSQDEMIESFAQEELKDFVGYSLK